MSASYFPRWTLRRDGVIAPGERLPAGQTLALGLQHVVAMFGLITATGGRIWVQNGAGDLALQLGGFTLGGIGTATFGALPLYQLWRDENGEPRT